jgi:hypothetical protein
LEIDLPGGQYGMAEEFTEKLTKKLREYMFLYDTGHPDYKNLFLLQLSANRRKSFSSSELDIMN